MKQRKYFCTKCDRNHHRGKIYKKHKKYKKIKYKPQKLYKFKKSAWDKLSVIAKRQLLRLADKMKKTQNKRLYYYAISQVLEHELDKKDLVPLK